MIQPIVEGDGEVEAVNILIGRILGFLGIYDVQIGKPIKRNRTDFVNQDRFKAALQLASLKPGVRAIIVVFDLDDDCARDIVPLMRLSVSKQIAHLPCGIALARREYEAWFLAAVESLRGFRGIQRNAPYLANPEEKRDAKGALKKMMPKKQPYSPTVDQAALSTKMDLGQAYRRASSFRKLVAELCRILLELGYQPSIPTEWDSNANQ